MRGQGVQDAIRHAARTEQKSSFSQDLNMLLASHKFGFPILGNPLVESKKVIAVGSNNTDLGNVRWMSQRNK